MKNTPFHTKAIHALTGSLLLGCLILFNFTACDSDDIEGNLYTKIVPNVGEYLMNNAADYSEFTAILDTTGVMGLLSTYGSYTCFVPDNEAMLTYYQSRGKQGWSDFHIDSLKQFAYDHIIMDWTIHANEFPKEGRIPYITMSDRYISINLQPDGTLLVNGNAKLIERDIEVNNGIIHRIEEALNPVRDGILEVVAKDSLFTLFYLALEETGLADSLLEEEDKSYDPELYTHLITTTIDAKNWFYETLPQRRLFGYTLLMESNATYAANGITDMASLKAKAAEIYDEVYPEDAGITNPKDRRNSLNRFVAYHLITKELGYNRFIDAYDTDQMLKTRDMYEYIETMCPNTLLEVCKRRSINGANLINWNPSTGTSVRIVRTNSDKEAGNGVYHEIDNLLVYDNAVHTMMSTKRLRFDSSSFFDELSNNNMRGRGVTDPNLRFMLPRGYLKRVTSSEQTTLGYLTGYPKYQNYEGDEIFLRAKKGSLYDFVIETLPIPEGTYEVRFGFGANSNRGVAQLYFDGEPCGVPLNLGNLGNDPSIGYVEPGTEEDDIEGFQNDKMMRNRGFMKAPAVFKAPNDEWFAGSEDARHSPNLLRRIMGIYRFTKAGRHTLGVKGLSGGEFMFDYMEFVPTSLLESEDIY
jgi:uncharacterized surface protein with fasciclin (FAS1) repeats